MEPFRNQTHSSPFQRPLEGNALGTVLNEDMYEAERTKYPVVAKFESYGLRTSPQSHASLKDGSSSALDDSA